jgi:hypothetical protein
MNIKLIKRSGLAVALGVILIVSGSWGFFAHKTIHQLAVYELPKKMQRFFYKNIDYVVSNAGRPDTRRNTDSTEAPKHFIDVEAYGGDSAIYKLPLHWNEAVKMFTEDTLKKYGYVPYHIIYMKEKLTEAFKRGIADSILFYATDLAHYIGDANVPLHTSINHDGQLTNQKGLHSLWETGVPSLEIENYNLHSKHHANYLGNPEESIMMAIRRAHSLLPDIFNEEKEVSANFTDSTKYVTEERRGRQFKSYSPSFVKAYGESLKNTINQQLINSADLVADFWYTSWVDAGKPNLDNLIATTFSKANKKAWKKERKAFRKNDLIETKLLRSKNRTDEKPAE